MTARSVSATVLVEARERVERLVLERFGRRARWMGSETFDQWIARLKRAGWITYNRRTHV